MLERQYENHKAAAISQYTDNLTKATVTDGVMIQVEFPLSGMLGSRNVLDFRCLFFGLWNICIYIMRYLWDVTLLTYLQNQYL